VSVDCSRLDRRAFSMQGTGHVKERLSLNGPGSARYPDSVVVGTLGPTATRVKESAEGRPGERLESFAEAGVRGTTPVEEGPRRRAALISVIMV
jgi:hypothetical protein